jgi:hypothetical protein
MRLGIMVGVVCNSGSGTLGKGVKADHFSLGPGLEGIAE